MTDILTDILTDIYLHIVKPVRVQTVTMEMPRADNAPQICSSLAGKHAASLPDFIHRADQDGKPARYFWITVLGGGVGFPLMFMRSLDALKVSSVVGNIGIMCRPRRAADHSAAPYFDRRG